jgi:hypothetical protein
MNSETSRCVAKYQVIYDRRNWLFFKKPFEYSFEIKFRAGNQVDAIRIALEDGINLDWEILKPVGDVEVRLLELMFGPQRSNLQALLKHVLIPENDLLYSFNREGKINVNDRYVSIVVDLRSRKYWSKDEELSNWLHAETTE